MGISANSQFMILRNLHLDHRWLLADDLVDSSYYLIDEFPMKLFATLEPSNHVLDERLCYFLSEYRSIVTILDLDGIYIKTLESRWWVRDLNSLLKSDPFNDLLALCQSKSCFLIIRLDLCRGLEVP